MDGTRPRRTLDRARQGWYSHWRAIRFARHLGFALPLSPRATIRLRETTRVCA